MIGGALLVGVLVVYPPFRLVDQEGAKAATPGSDPQFDAVAFATTFWSERLLPAAKRTTPLETLVADLQRDPTAAAKQHAHRVGLGHAAYYFARGSGRVTAVERSRLLVEVGGRVIAIRTGPIFGNIVRDGGGLLDVNQVPGLAEFNALSAELNRLVEERVLPSLRSGVAVGSRITFAGCAEAPEALPPSDAPLLHFVPVQAEVHP